MGLISQPSQQGRARARLFIGLFLHPLIVLASFKPICVDADNVWDDPAFIACLIALPATAAIVILIPVFKCGITNQRQKAGWLLVIPTIYALIGWSAVIDSYLHRYK